MVEKTFGVLANRLTKGYMHGWVAQQQQWESLHVFGKVL